MKDSMKGRTEGYLLGVIGVGALVNALAMLVASERWFEAVAHHTGAFNVHLIRDVAFAYATTGAALLWAATRAELRGPLCLVAAAFLGLHALGHVLETATGALPAAHWYEDAPGVFLPALLVGWIAVRNLGGSALASDRPFS